MPAKRSDAATLFAKRAIDFMFVANPSGTSFGILLGVVINAVMALFQPLLSMLRYIDLRRINVAETIAIGVVAMNIRTVRRRRLPPQIEALFAESKEAVQSGALTEADLRQRYRALIDVVIANVQIDSETA